MNIYRVGGSVRDMLRGYPPKDFDFVVVGATVPEFLAKYPDARQIGKSFPVFQIPTRDFVIEVAFARKERKTGPGHNDFEVVADPNVTLEEDLYRRDLTINAIAMPLVEDFNKSRESQVIDPFGGVSDLRLGVLRHVGPAFGEDALRVFRLARFASTLGFVVAPETERAAREVPYDDIAALSAERVCEEFRKAMRSNRPRAFVEVLARSGALSIWFPELRALSKVPAGPPQHHGEGDAFIHTLMVLDSVAHLGDEKIATAALFHDLGKGITPPEYWPSHHNHDEYGVPLVETACNRIKLPTDMKVAAMMVCRQHMRVHWFTDMKKGKMADLVQAADRTSIKAEGLVAVCHADSIGRIPSAPSDGANALEVAAEAARSEKGHPIPPALKGEHIGLHVRRQKGTAIRRALKEKGLV